MFEYALEVHEEPSSVWLSCAEIPEMHAAGDTLEEALDGAIDAMETALSIYVDDRRLIPTGDVGEQESDAVLRLPALTAAKVGLWNTLLESGVSKAELARRLGGATTPGRSVSRFPASLQDRECRACIAAAWTADFAFG